MRPLQSLYLRFGVVSLVPILALGAFLSVTLRTTIETRASSAYLTNAQTMFRLMAGSLLSPTDFEGPITSDRVTLFDDLLIKAGPRESIKVRLLSPTGAIVYSTDHAEVGDTPVVVTEARRAFDGQPSTRFSNGTDDSVFNSGQRQIELFIPVVLDGRQVGIVEAAGIDPNLTDNIDRDVRHTQYALATGLAVLWLALLPILASVSRRLRRQSDENHYLALHDLLTGLPNRNLLHSRLAAAAADPGAPGTLVGLLLVDLDRFKEINDTLGHAKGDELLIQVAARVRDLIEPTDTVSRLGGDEFAVVVVGRSRCEDVEAVGRALTAAFAEPFVVDGFALSVEASIGVAIQPIADSAPEQLLQQADIAMYSAKLTGVDQVRYSADLDRHSAGQLALATDLRRALNDPTGQLVLHFQPAASPSTASVPLVEALVRWHHPTRGLLAPGDFVPLAERSGLIRPLTTLVLDLAVAQARRWSDQGQEVAVAVNLSARNLMDATIADQVRECLQRHDLPARLLELEVTETGVLDNPDEAVRLLGDIRSLGVSIALDDFGTGYSSLTYLKRLRPDRLKIDRSFVAAMPHNPTDEHIVSALILLAHSLGMGVTAEGVETQAQWLHLDGLNCDLIQGYYLARPMPAAEFEAWLNQRTTVLYGPTAS